MTDWKKHYDEHLTTAGEVAATIKAGDVIWMGQGPQIPFTMLEEMYQHMSDYHDVTILYNVSTQPISALFDYESKKHFRFISFFNLPLERISGEMGILEYHSCGFDHIREGIFEYGCNMVALHVCPPDEDGWCNLGHYGVSTGSLVVNDPRIVKKIGFIDRTGQYPIPGEHKDVSIHISEFDYIVECDTEMVEIPPTAPTQVDKDMAAYILPYIKPGDKLQVGFGGLGDEILAHLHECGPLEVFTEVVCESMLDLVEEGVLTSVLASSPGACKERFFKFAAHDSRIRFLPVDKVISLFEISNQDNMLSINCTFMVDLLGQACSEAQGLKPYSGVGGSFAFIYGAMRSKGGRNFLCLRSTHKGENGELESNIVPWLPEGSIVTTPKNYQTYIVTEYGVADVYLKTIRDRIRALIKIAHPDFRAWLKEKILCSPLIREDDFDGYDLGI